VKLVWCFGGLSLFSFTLNNVWKCVYLDLTCRVLHTKSLLSSPHTLWAATTNTSTRNTNTIESQILPNAVEYLLTPLSRLSSPDQFIPAAAAWVTDESSLWRKTSLDFTFFALCGEEKVKFRLVVTKDQPHLAELLTCIRARACMKHS